MYRPVDGAHVKSTHKKTANSVKILQNDNISDLPPLLISMKYYYMIIIQLTIHIFSYQEENIMDLENKCAK